MRGRRVSWGLLSAVLAHTVLRALVLHTAFDSVAVWMYELAPMGTLAETVLRRIPVPAHLFYANAGGQVLAGYASIPAFALLGSSYLALKVVPFLLGLGTLLLVHAYLRAAFGPTAGVLGAWFVALAPTTFFKYSLVCSGNHPENVFLCAAVLVLFQRLHASGIGSGRLFRLGAVAGLSLSNSLGSAIVLAILGAMHVRLRGSRLAARDLVRFLPGFLLGVVPLLALELASRGRGTSFFSTTFGATGAPPAIQPGPVLSRFVDFLLVRPAAAAAYPSLAGIPGTALGWIFFGGSLAAGAAGGALLARGVRDRAATTWLVPLLLAPVLTALAYAFSSLVIHGDAAAPLGFLGYRYFLPTFLYAMLATAAVAGRAIGLGGRARLGGTLLAAAVLAPGLANLRLVDWSFSSTGAGRAYRGYDLSRIGRSLVSGWNGVERGETLRYLDRLPADVRAQVARGIGFNLAIAQLDRRKRAGGERATDPSVDLEAILSGFAERDRPEIARGAGSGTRFLRSSPGGPSGILTTIRATRYDPDFVEGLLLPNTILPLAEVSPRSLQWNERLIEAAAGEPLSAAVLERLASGQGFLCGSLDRRGIRSDRAAVEEARGRIPSGLEAAYSAGFDAGASDYGPVR